MRLKNILKDTVKTQSSKLKTFGDVEGYDDMVLEKNISLESHCEHHMAPIIGVVHIAYIPNQKVVGFKQTCKNSRVAKKTSNSRKTKYANSKNFNGSS